MSTNICYFIFCTLWRQTILIKSLYFQIKRAVRELKEWVIWHENKKTVKDLYNVNNHLYEDSMWNRFFHRCQEFAPWPFNKVLDLQDYCKTYFLHSHFKILFFFRQNLKKYHQLSMNYVPLKNVKRKFIFTEAYLELSQTSTMELFYKNS